MSISGLYPLDFSSRWDNPKPFQIAQLPLRAKVTLSGEPLL